MNNINVNTFYSRSLSINELCPITPHFVRSKLNTSFNQIKSADRVVQSNDVANKNMIHPDNYPTREKTLSFKKDESCFLHMCSVNLVAGITPSNKLVTPISIKENSDIKINELVFHSLIAEGYIPIEENPKINIPLLDILRSSYTNHMETFRNNYRDFLEQNIRSGLYPPYHVIGINNVSVPIMCMQTYQLLNPCKLGNNVAEFHYKNEPNCSLALRGIKNTDVVDLIRIIETNNITNSEENNNKFKITRVITPYECKHLYLITDKAIANDNINSLINDAVIKHNKIENISNKASSFFTKIVKYLPARTEFNLQEFNLKDKDPLLFITNNQSKLKNILLHISMKNNIALEDKNHNIKATPANTLATLTDIEFIKDSSTNKLKNIILEIAVYYKNTNKKEWKRHINSILTDDIIKSSSIEEVINKLRIQTTFAIITSLINSNCSQVVHVTFNSLQGVWCVDEGLYQIATKIPIEDIFNYETQLLSPQVILQESLDLNKGNYDEYVSQGDINMTDYYI